MKQEIKTHIIHSKMISLQFQFYHLFSSQNTYNDAVFSEPFSIEPIFYRLRILSLFKIWMKRIKGN